MNFLLPAIGAVLQAGSSTLDKVVLSVRGVTHKTYIGVSYPLMAIFALILFFIFHPPLPLELFTGSSLGLILISLAFLIVSTSVLYEALDSDSLGEIKTVGLLRNLPVIIFSSLLFADERNTFVLILAVVATLAVAWAHYENHRFCINRHTLIYLLWTVIVSPLGPIISKVLLVNWDPISLVLIQNAGVAIILGPLYYGDYKEISLKTFLLLLATNFLSIFSMAISFLSYKVSGVVFTILIFSLEPLLVYFASIFFLREPVKFKKVVAFFIVLASIIVAQVLG